jgi:hypothetical protein
MDQVSEAARIDRELEEAQRDLRNTLEQVNHKVERAGGRLRPKAIIRSNTFALACIAAVLGYFAGSEDRPPRLRWLAMGALLGSALAASGKHSGDESAAGE